MSSKQLAYKNSIKGDERRDEKDLEAYEGLDLHLS